VIGSREKASQMSLHQPTHTVISFGPFEANQQTQELTRQGVPLRLPRQSFQILTMLLQRPGELIPREELRLTLWPSDTFVDFEKGINAAINRLRETLGDSAENPRYVETLPRRGYRFIAPVTSPVATTIKPQGQLEAVPSPASEAKKARAASQSVAAEKPRTLPPRKLLVLISSFVVALIGVLSTIAVWRFS
jgi:DNA-binding winged helix-turn-helix (wHTH) protein